MNRPPGTWLPPPRLRLLYSVCVLLIAGLIFTPAPMVSPSDDENRYQYSQQEIRRAMNVYARQYRLDPALLRAVIKAESNFRPRVVSSKGAVGLMQLTPATAATLPVADLYDPVQNMRGGAEHLRSLLTRYEGNVPLALAAYNAGVHRVTGGILPPIRETRLYVQKVLGYYEAFHGAGPARWSEPQGPHNSPP